MIHTEIRQPTPAEIAARRARLMGAAPQRPKAPSLTLVKPEQVVKVAPTLVNAAGNPRKIKPRPDADDHVWVHRVHLLQQKERLTPTEHARLRCLEARVSFDLFRSSCRNHNLVPLRNQIAWELRQRGLSYPAIGQVLNREHTAIIHCVRKIDAKNGDERAQQWVARKSRQSTESFARQRQRKAV